MLLPGLTVERYLIERLVGRGGMASVYAVRHTVLGTRHALKVLHRADPDLRDRLVREGQLQARLDPAHVVPVTDVIDVYGTPALLMPFVDGCSLAELMIDHRLSETEAVALMRDVAAGVACAHGRGIAHRDLKPANVLVEIANGRVVARVADFGLARLAGADPAGATQGGVFLGTPAYASPEQLADAAGVDVRTDLWALGVMLYEAFTGRRPPSERGAPARPLTADELLGVPARWRDVVAVLLQPDREHRTVDAAALAVALGVGAVGLPSDGPVGVALARSAGRAETRAPLALATATIASGARVAPVEPSRSVHNLPAERDAFVGRDADLAALAEHLDAGARLLSILGLGGSGKTRLAVRLGRRTLGDWPGGVWFCDLSEARSLDGIIYAVAQALGVPLGKSDAVVQLGHAIAGRGKCLLILDNFEQVAQFAPQSLTRWLDRAEDARFVVTTRQVLGVAGEELHRLDSLEESDAVALFVARAQQAQRGYVLTPEDHASLVALVRLLDGLPLAIELAAARVPLMSPTRLLDRMADRFRVLASTASQIPRHATLRATLDWSWDLLGRDEQAALAQLSVFDGGFGLDAAEAVLSLGDTWPLNAVQGLLEKSLVRAVGHERFGLLVSVQAFAAEKLAKEQGVAAAEERHGAHFALSGTHAALLALECHGGVPRRQRLVLVLDNLLAACRRATARGDVGIAAATLRAAWAVLGLQGPFEVGAELARGVLALPMSSPADRGSAAFVLGQTQMRLGRAVDSDAAFAIALAASKDAADRVLEFEVTRARGNLALSLARLDEARAWTDAASLILQELGTRASLATLENDLGVMAWAYRRLDEARGHYEAGLRSAREVGDRRMEGLLTLNLGMLSRSQGRMAEAGALYAAAAVIVREVRDGGSEATCLTAIGELQEVQGQQEEAWASYERALRAARYIGHRRDEGTVLGKMGELLRIKGEYAEARPRLEAAAAIHAEFGFAYGQSSWLHGLAMLDVEAGDLDRALARMEEALALAASYVVATAEMLAGLALVHVARGSLPEARAAVARARTLGQVDGPGASVAAVDAVVAAAAGDRAAAEAALAEATRDPRWCAPRTDTARVIAMARARLAADA